MHQQHKQSFTIDAGCNFDPLVKPLARTCTFSLISEFCSIVKRSGGCQEICWTFFFCALGVSYISLARQLDSRDGMASPFVTSMSDCPMCLGIVSQMPCCGARQLNLHVFRAQAANR